MIVPQEDALATHEMRNRRLKRIVNLLPSAGTGAEFCMDARSLLERLGDAYAAANESARLRLLQRDLQDLTKQERIEAIDPRRKPLRYRRRAEFDDDPEIWQYTLDQIRDLVEEIVPRRQLDRLWARLAADQEPILDAQRFRVVPDTLRLQPVELYPEVLLATITALRQGEVLEVIYRSANKPPAKAQLHPHALIQRGPIPYLLALKNDETEPLRFYALHRMISAQVLTGSQARQMPSFNLDDWIADGKVDFGQGKCIKLELRVRGYLTEVLQACPLEPKQELEDEPDGADFAIRVRATLPATGQLLRWLLGAGNNLEVVAPEELRSVVAAQAAKMAALYAAPPPSAP